MFSKTAFLTVNFVIQSQLTSIFMQVICSWVAGWATRCSSSTPAGRPVRLAHTILNSVAHPDHSDANQDPNLDIDADSNLKCSNSALK